MEMKLLGDLEVPAIAAAIEAHQRRITQAILDHAMKICTEKNVGAIPTFCLYLSFTKERNRKLRVPFVAFCIAL